MLVDIFSSFDDCNQVFMSMYMLVWGFSLVVILILGSSFWFIGSSWVVVIFMLKDIVFSQIFRSFGYNMGGFLLVMSGLFLCLVLMNISGLIPYVFSCTSHLVVAFSLGFPLWMSLIFSAVFLNWGYVVGGLLPLGAPSLLNPFLVIIETVSIMVRPITLSVRLVANMSAGHIVLTLVGDYIVFSGFFNFWALTVVLVVIQVFYVIFEFGISVVQAYIFFLLITLYSDDHPH